MFSFADVYVKNSLMMLFFPSLLIFIDPSFAHQTPRPSLHLYSPFSTLDKVFWSRNEVFLSLICKLKGETSQKTLILHLLSLQYQFTAESRLMESSFLRSKEK